MSVRFQIVSAFLMAYAVLLGACRLLSLIIGVPFWVTLALALFLVLLLVIWDKNVNK